MGLSEVSLTGDPPHRSGPTCSRSYGIEQGRKIQRKEHAPKEIIAKLRQAADVH